MDDKIIAARKIYADYGARKAKEAGAEQDKEWRVKVLAGDADDTHGVQIALLALQSLAQP